MPKALARAALFFLAVVAGGASNTAAAQVTAAKEAPATISGRITIEDKAVAGIIVLLTPPDQSSRRKVAARATTDAEGRYQLTNVPPGRYQLMPSAPAFVIPDVQGWPPGRPITAAAGETIENVDFKLTRGGVITGRITDADGKPVIAENVDVSLAGKGSQGATYFYNLPFRHATDDRGVYRIYGLMAGSYRVSIGQDKNSGMIRMGGPGRYFQKTFHPDTSDESQAHIVEVAAGGEVTDVDITVGKPSRTFRASGRIVNAETGQPIPNITFGYGAVAQDGKSIGAYGGGLTANARGEFVTQGLTPGRYAVFAVPEPGSVEWYSDTATFEIDEADVGGLEIKTHRGASISGQVLIEGVSDRARAARMMSQLSLGVTVEARTELMPQMWTPVQVSPDGSFRISGVRPGKVRLMLGGWPPPKGFTLLRVERDGVEQRAGIEVAEGAQLTGVRAVISYGIGVVRGQVNVVGGALPQGARMWVYARRAGTPDGVGYGRPWEVDARGHFVIEGLAAGDYEISLSVWLPGVGQRATRQSVTVGEGGETVVTIVFDSTVKTGDKEVAP